MFEIPLIAGGIVGILGVLEGFNLFSLVGKKNQGMLLGISGVMLALMGFGYLTFA